MPQCRAEHLDVGRCEAVALGVKLLGISDRNTGEWIERAIVRDTLGHELLSSKLGMVALNALAPVVGAYLLEVRKAGYLTQRVRIPEKTAEFMIALEPDAVGAMKLPAVVIEARVSLKSDPGLADGFFCSHNDRSPLLSPATK